MTDREQYMPRAASGDAGTRTERSGRPFSSENCALAAESLAGGNRPGASARVGVLRQSMGAWVQLEQ